MEAKPLYQILVVDDEVGIVNAVRRELSSPPLGHNRYEIECFTDPVSAIERAKNKHFDAVISDYRMPGMDGLVLLKALAELQPDCARLVLSGETDMDGLCRMINESHIYRFIPKPWHDYFLKSSLSQAIDYAQEISENKRLADLVRQRGVSLPETEGGRIEPILIVDDEPSVLTSLSRALTRHAQHDELFAAINAELSPGRPLLNESGISLQTTTSPRHALLMAKELTFSCIITDYRMAEMNGAELLQKFAAEQPDCVRLLISGQINESELIGAVDLAHIFGFINKPWQDFELKLNVAQALAWRRIQIENRTLAKMVKAATH
jgi:DNA-binding NtrC family response regulator